MGYVYPGSGSGATVLSDDLTAARGDVLKGKTFMGSDTDDDIGTGTLELTGNAEPKYVYSGKTFYSNNPKSKQTGSLNVPSLVSFSVASISGARVTLRWQNPSTGPYGGVIIRVKEGSYPTSVNDGTEAYRGYGTSYAVNAVSTTVWVAPKNNTTFYFRAWMYSGPCSPLNVTLYSGYKQATAKIPLIQGQQVITSSTIFRVPEGVTHITVFVAGGGGGGGHPTQVRQAVPGAGGGYTATREFDVTPLAEYAATIGAGGKGGVYQDYAGGNGGVTSFGNLISANGGNGTNGGQGTGGAGGSGGGSRGRAASGDYGGEGGDGGTDGSHGHGATGGSTVSGPGQGTTTKAFGESSGTLYSGGGGGGGYYNGFGGSAGDSTAGSGGSGWGLDADGYGGPGGDGDANTGGAGGGGGGGSSTSVSRGGDGGAGGSGIIIVRWGY